MGPFIRFQETIKVDVLPVCLFIYLVVVGCFILI